MSLEAERTLRDKMVMSLENGRNSMRLLTEAAYQHKAKLFLDDLRKVDNEFSLLTDKIRSSPSGIDRKEITTAMKFDALYTNTCELASDQIESLHSKVIESKFDFQPFVPELYTIRKMLVDMQNAWGGRINAISQANMTAYTIKNKLDKKDLRDLGETISDLQKLAEENDQISERIAKAITKDFQAIDAEVEKLRSASQSEPVKKAVSLWDSLKGKVSSHKGLTVAALGVAAMLVPLAIPGIAFVPTALNVIHEITDKCWK